MQDPTSKPKSSFFFTFLLAAFLAFTGITVTAAFVGGEGDTSCGGG